MKLTSAEIDEVVRRVLSQFEVAAGNRTTSRQSVEQSGTREIGEHVVTTHQLGDLSAGITISVPAAAVITPAARDLLRERNVAVIRRKSKGAQARGESLQLAAAGGYDTGPLASSLKRAGIETEISSAGSLIDTLQLLAENLSLEGRQAVLLTGETAAAVCLANRSRAIRAIAATSRAEICRASGELAPNLLVLDPAGIDLARLSAAIRVFYESRNLPAAASYRSALEQ
jgi:uncharacterized membrane protein